MFHNSNLLLIFFNLFQFNNFFTSNNFLFCRKGDQLRHCVEQELLKCKDPTPSNVVNAMFIAMWNSTPCKKIMDRDGERILETNEASLSSSSCTRPSLWSHLLTLSLHLIIPSLTLLTSISKKCLDNASVR